MKKITLLLILLNFSFGHSQNLITNGDFESGAAGWSGSALNVVTEGGNSYNSANVMSAGEPYFVNLSYVLPIMTQGQAYKLTFDAFSDGARPLIAGIGLNQDPWTSAVTEVTLSATSQTFVLTFIANFANANSRIIFDMGHATGFVGIDNVVLELTTTTCNNGVQDGDETGVDCGGSCTACIPTPPVAAPTPPARPAADVVSIYSDAYNNIGLDNFDAGWCGGAATTQIQLFGNNTLRKNPGVVCHGIEFPSNRQNLTDFTHVHFDFYITDTNIIGDVFNFKLVNFAGGNSEANALEVNINGGTTPQLVANQWVSVDVPITSLGSPVFGNLARQDVAQIGITTANVTSVYYDNIYLHKNTVLSNTDFNAVTFKVYPNPSSNNVNISSSNVIENISLYSVLGQEILTRTGSSNEMNVDISNLQKGVYLLKAEIEGQVKTTRIVKE